MMIKQIVITQQINGRPPPDLHFVLVRFCVVIYTILIITAKQEASSIFVITSMQEPS